MDSKNVESASHSPSDEEKRAVSLSDDHLAPELPNVDDPDAGKSAEERARIDRKLLWKLDWKLIPWLSFLYLISFLDRTNIGNARVFGLERDLGMNDSQYYAALTIFFVPYALAEPLTNILVKRLRPSIFLPIIMILWGICMALMGVVHNFSGLAATRFFLGLTEAGLFPGVNYYLSCWYKRSEFGIRAAIFFSAAALAGSFGGLLAAALNLMRGVGGRPGWAWIFIIEGLVTILVGVASYWLVHDFPDEAKFLSSDDRARVLRRLHADQQASARHEDFSMKYVLQSLADWKTYAFAVIYMGADGALYAFSLFTPTIINELGYQATTANLLSVPPYAAAAILTVAVGFYADRTGQRGFSNIVVSVIGVAGFIMLIASTQPAVKYAGTFLGALGIYPCIANTISWASNNTEGVYKRGVTLGIVIGWGNLNGVVSSNIYRNGPRFFEGHGTVLGYLAVFLLGGSIVTHLGLRWENSRKLKGKMDHLVQGKSREEIDVLGDKRPDFLYTL